MHPLRRHPVRLHEANGVRCPNPECATRVGTRKMLSGYLIDTCPLCQLDYLVWASYGVAQVTGLTPEQATRFETDTPRLAVILRELGVIAA